MAEITRKEKYLKAIGDGDSSGLPDPITRQEYFLAKAAGMDVKTPAPITREEMYLDNISGGGGVTVEPITITENGTTTAPEGTAYSPVNVNVPNTYEAGDEGKVVSNGALVSQTSANINSNGTVDTTLNNQVVVSVPNSYVAADEGKVVSNGALVAQTSTTITENGTVDTTLNNQVTVNVSASANGVIWLTQDNDGYPLTVETRGLKELGAYAFFKNNTYGGVYSRTTSVVLNDEITSIAYAAFNNNNSIVSLVLPANLTTLADYSFYGISVQTLEIPSGVAVIPMACCASCGNLREVIFKGNITNIGGNAFSACTNVLKYDFTHCTAIPTLVNENVFGGGSINHDCQIVVPDSLYESWKTTGYWQNGNIVGHIVKESEYTA